MGKKAEVTLKLELDLDDDIPSTAWIFGSWRSENVAEVELIVTEFILDDRYWLPNAIQQALNNGDDFVEVRIK